MPLNKVNLLSPLVTNSSSVTPENVQRWSYSGADVAAITPTGMLDLRASTTGSLASGSVNGNIGTKIVFYSNDNINPTWGFGLNSSRLIGLIDSNSGAFSIRTSIGGSDIIRLFSDGNISGRYLDSINNSGGYLDLGTGSSGMVAINRVASHIPFSVRGASSQTANLQEWQNSSSTILSKVESTGIIRGPLASGDYLYPIYETQTNGGNDTSWKKLITVNLPTGLYVGLSFIIDIIDTGNNMGAGYAPNKSTYVVSVVRSGGTQDDSDTIYISGPEGNKFLQGLKIDNGTYEIQFRQPTDWSQVSVKIQGLSAQAYNTTYGTHYIYYSLWTPTAATITGLDIYSPTVAAGSVNSNTFSAINLYGQILARPNNVTTTPIIARAITRTNLVPNPSFEVNTTGWVDNFSNATMARTTSQAQSGTASLAITSVAAGDMAVRYGYGNTGIPVTAGLTYTFSAYIKSSTSARSVRIFPNWFTDNTFVSGSNQAMAITSSTSGWTRIYVTLTAPSGVNYACPYITILGAAAAGEVHYLDSVMIEQSPILSGYIDTTASTSVNLTEWQDSAFNILGKIDKDGKATFAGLTLTGDLTVGGTTTTISTTNLNVSDPMIYMGGGNTADIADLGIVSSFNNGTYQHSGFVRDATDGKWKLFSGVTAEPTTTVDFTSATYDTLKAGTFEGNLTGNVTGTVSGNAGTVTNGIYTTTTSLPNVTSVNSTTIPASATLVVSGANSNITSITGLTTALSIAQGGTGATTAMTAATALLPSQTSNSGKYLTNDGAGTLSWGTVSGYSAPTIGSTSIGSGATVTTIAGLTLTSPTISTIINTGTLTLPTATGILALTSQTFYIGTQAIAINAGTGTITSLPGVTSVNGTTIPSSATLLTSASTASALTSFGASPTISTSLTVTGGALGGTAGNELVVHTISATNSNNDKVQTRFKRITTGADWTTAQAKIQRTIDVTDMGYIAFGSTSTYDVRIGSNVTDIAIFAPTAITLSQATTVSGTISATGLAGSLLSSATPIMDGTAAAGTSAIPARQDHVHASDTSRAAVGQTMYIGTTGVAINRATADLALAGITSITGTSTLTLNSTTTSALSIDSTTTGPINIGNNSNAKTITIGNAIGATAVVINSGTAGTTFNTNATSFVKVAAASAPTVDMVQISNAGFANISAGISALQVNYVGGAAAVESSAARIDITPGTTTGGTWNGFRVIPSATATTGVIYNAMKFDTVTTGLGTDNVIYVGTGYDNIINYNGTSIISGTGLLNLASVTGTLAATNGGTAQSTYATGDIVYASASNTLSKRTIGSTGQVLIVSGGVPTWGSVSASGIPIADPTEPASPVDGQIWVDTDAASTTVVDNFVIMMLMGAF